MSEHDCTTNPLVSEPQNSPAQELTAEKLRELLHYDPETAVFTWKVSTTNSVKAGDVAGYVNNGGYLLISIQGRAYQAHRLSWFYTYGEWPKASIDHINRNRLDNRIANLRDVSHKQNLQNASKRSDNTSGYTGISRHRLAGKWQAHITHNQKSIYLGLFENLEDAVTARKAAERFYWADTQLAEPTPV